MKYLHLFVVLCSITTISFITCSSWLCEPVISVARTAATRCWLSVASSNGMVIVPEGKLADKKIDTSLLISVQGKQVTFNSKPIKKGTWYLLPYSGEFTVNNKIYAGPATLHVDSDRLAILAHKKEQHITDLVWNNARTASAPRSYIIRVLIHELLSSDIQQLALKSNTGFILYNPHARDQQKEYKNNILLIGYKKNCMWVNGHRFDQPQIRIIPKDGYVGINESQFHGSLSLVNHENRLLVINHVDLEEYIYAVLRTESFPGWPIEVNKAFAIASRSYAMSLMQKTKKVKQPYHIKNTTEHQTYKGMHQHLALRTAVEATRGVFLMYQNEPVLAMFDCCCGGIIPAHVDQFDFSKAPYLARNYACTHCKRCALYAWKKEWSLTDFNKQITGILQKPITVQDVKISKKDKAGLVHELQVHHGKESSAISGKQFYSALKKNIKSFCYTVQRKKDTLIFSGRGLGHHIGICQWGAREMVRDGWSYKRILSFYYPGTELMKLV